MQVHFRSPCSIPVMCCVTSLVWWQSSWLGSRPVGAIIIRSPCSIPVMCWRGTVLGNTVCKCQQAIKVGIHPRGMRVGAQHDAIRSTHAPLSFLKPNRLLTMNSVTALMTLHSSIIPQAETASNRRATTTYASSKVTTNVSVLANGLQCCDGIDGKNVRESGRPRNARFN